MFRNIDAYLLMGFAWFIIGVIDLLRTGKLKEKNILLALLTLTILAVNMLDHIAKARELFYFFHYISHNAYLLIGPVMYLYTLSLLDHKLPKKLNILLLTLPFIFYVIIMIVFKDDYLQGMPANNRDRVQGYVKFNLPNSRMYIAGIQNIIYFILIQVKIHIHNSKLFDFYSYQSFYDRLTWLRVLLLVAIPYYLTILISMCMPLLGYREFILRAPAKFNLLCVVFIFFFVVFSRKQNIPMDVKTSNSLKYKKSSINREQLQSIHNELTEIVGNKKLYLKSDLNLDNLSSELGVTKHSLSQALNIVADMNFYMFINKYRIQESKDSIKDGRYPNYSLLGIAMECGFRSQSTFYSIFKKFENITPREYVKSLTA